jgi:rubrerythrin
MQVKTFDDYRDALQLAMKREEEATYFYETLADKVHQADQKALLKRLAIEEKGHKELLDKFASEVKNPPKGSFTPPEYSFDKVKEKNLTIEELFQLAIQKEEESLNFYARFLVYFFKTGHEEIFRKIFEVELQHKEQLEGNFKNFIKK